MKRKKNGSGSLIIFIVFIVVVVLIVGIMSAMNQTKSVLQSNYMESSLRTYYLANSGFQESLATRFIPPSNIYASK